MIQLLVMVQKELHLLLMQSLLMIRLHYIQTRFFQFKIHKFFLMVIENLLVMNLVKIFHMSMEEVLNDMKFLHLSPHKKSPR